MIKAGTSRFRFHISSAPYFTCEIFWRILVHMAPCWNFLRRFPIFLFPLTSKRTFDLLRTYLFPLPENIHQTSSLSAATIHADLRSCIPSPSDIRTSFPLPNVTVHFVNIPVSPATIIHWTTCVLTTSRRSCRSERCYSYALTVYTLCPSSRFSLCVFSIFQLPRHFYTFHSSDNPDYLCFVSPSVVLSRTIFWVNYGCATSFRSLLRASSFHLYPNMSSPPGAASRSYFVLHCNQNIHPEPFVHILHNRIRACMLISGSSILSPTRQQHCKVVSQKYKPGSASGYRMMQCGTFESLYPFLDLTLRLSFYHLTNTFDNIFCFHVILGAPLNLKLNRDAPPGSACFHSVGS